jgi:hypothetical protein
MASWTIDSLPVTPAGLLQLRDRAEQPYPPNLSQAAWNSYRGLPGWMENKEGGGYQKPSPGNVRILLPVKMIHGSFKFDLLIRAG